MKSILISIKPKYCELISSGKKTVEVRKTKPKLETPFKVYIYCTKQFYRKGNGYFQGKYCGKVIGEFVCDAIFPISCYYSDVKARGIHREQPYTCLTDKEMIDYLGNGVEGYGWHISNLVIYDKPRELSEFQRYPKTEHCGWGECDICRHGDFDQIDEEWFCRNIITRPPQSWCYVERSENGT